MANFPSVITEILILPVDCESDGALSLRLQVLFEGPHSQKCRNAGDGLYGAKFAALRINGFHDSETRTSHNGVEVREVISHIDKRRRYLGEPGNPSVVSLRLRENKPIVFGVCKALADRFGMEPWSPRLASIVLTLFWALPALAAYIVAVLVMKETEDRTRRFFSGLAVVLREYADKAAASLREGFRGKPRDAYRHRGY